MSLVHVLGFLSLLLLSVHSFAAVPERDLRDYCPTREKCPILNLQGDWAFQKGQLLTSETIHPAAITAVPGIWSPAPKNPFDPSWEEARDVGTYALILRHLRPETGLVLNLSNVHSSYRLYWQPLGRADRLLFQLGWNEKDPLQSEAGLREDLIPLPLEAETSDYMLLLQVANADIAKGGLRVAPQIGIGQDFQKQQIRNYVIYGLMNGAILIIAFYHLLIFMQRRSDTSALWLAIQCFSVASNSLAMQGFVSLVFPEPSTAIVHLRTWMMYAPHIIAPIGFYAFIVHHYPAVRHPAAPWVLGIPSALIACLAFTPLFFLSRLYVVVFAPVMTIFVLFLLWRCVAAAIHDKGFRWIVAGIFFLGMMAIHDGLAGSGAVKSSGLLPLGEVVFIMIQGGLISRRFAAAYRQASRSKRDLEKEVQRQTREIRSILETIKQGILTIHGVELKLGADASRYLLTLFPKANADTRMIEILDQIPELSSDQKDQMQQAIAASLGEQALAFELNQHLLPKELILVLDGQQRVFEVDWSPVIDGQNAIEKILVCLRDVSEIRRLRVQTQQNEEETRIMHELIHIPEAQFRSFLQRTLVLLGETQTLILSLEEERALNRREAVDQIFMNVHTVKGSARTLQFTGIATKTHDLEQEVAQLRRNPESRDLDPFRERMRHLREVLAQYQDISQRKLDWDPDADRVRVPKKLLLETQHFLGSLTSMGLPADSLQKILQLERALDDYSVADLRHAVLEAARGLDSMARDLQKEPPLLHVNAGSIMLSESGQDLVQKVYTHVFRNAIDHGLESSAERKLRGKPAQGSIQVDAEIEDQMLRVSCFDDGRGLDLAKIKERALEFGIASALLPWTAQATAALIFKPGLSTKDAVTEISGRGVGMDAVMRFVEQAGGRVELELRGQSHDTGFMKFAVILWLPASLYWQARTPALMQIGA